MNYRNSPINVLEYSPAELLQNREPRSKLIISDKILHPKNPDVYKDILINKQKQKEYYDMNSRKMKIPRSYVVKDSHIWIKRRNAIFIKKMKRT